MFGPDGKFPLSVTDSLAAHQVPPSPEELQQMMHQPGFQQAMNQVLSDPRMVDYLIQSQPQLQAMGPGIRQYMQSDEFRRKDRKIFSFTLAGKEASESNG